MQLKKIYAVEKKLTHIHKFCKAGVPIFNYTAVI